jgi:hypothetical protein
MLNFKAKKTIQSELIALSPFIPMGFLKIILALLLLNYYCLIKVKGVKISSHQTN